MQILRAIPALAVLIVAAVHGDKLIAAIRPTEMMTLDEQEKTGVAKLTTPQKKELDLWINDHFTLKPVESSSALTLQQNLQNGSQLQLSDGSIYAIAPADQSKTSFWLTPFTIRIADSGDPAYPVLLTNSRTGESVKAKLIKRPN